MGYNNEYSKQAKDFLKACGATISIYHKKDSNNLRAISPMTGGYLYRVRIDRAKKSCSFDFSDSKHNYLNNERPDAYDVLACITKYEVDPDIWDFAREFGYEIHDKETFKEVSKIHRAVVKEYKNVVRMFGDVLDELAEIQ